MPSYPAFVERQFRKPYVDFALCLLLKRRRLALPQVDPGRLWPGFESAPVTLRTLPKGDWSAPTNDMIVLLKLAAAAKPMRILELGSYRGYTAQGLLEHTSPDATLVAVDIDPQHGEAYLGTALEARIDRRVGAIGTDMFDADEAHSFDLVFVDADHRREAAEHDTEVAFEMVAPDGMVLWHDYSNWGWFTGDCGVPEVLNELAGSLPICHLTGSNIAAHLMRWRDHHDEFEALVDETKADFREGHWRSTAARRFGF